MEMDRAQLRWFGHTVRIPQDGVNKKDYQGEVPGRRNPGRPRRRWLDGVGTG